MGWNTLKGLGSSRHDISGLKLAKCLCKQNKSGSQLSWRLNWPFWKRGPAQLRDLFLKASWSCSRWVRTGVVVASTRTKADWQEGKMLACFTELPVMF